MTEQYSAYIHGLEAEVMAQWRKKSRNELYRTDPEAWLWDVLGYRWHAKQRQIADDFLNNRRIGVKSANGTGKTRQFSELITWGIATHEPGELFIIVSGPSADQLKLGMFAYLDKNIQRAKQRGFDLPGYLTDSERWNYRVDANGRAQVLVTSRTPPRTNIVGTFQGIRAVADTEVKTWVFIDEGGAVHDDLFTAAEAVTTGAADNKICVIGNPDMTGTHFQKIFEDEQLSQDWVTSTISAYDLPTFTGEVVYDDPVAQEQMLKSGMIDFKWVETAKRQWGENSARYKSKVLGQFPDVSDWAFFSQLAINMAEATQIDPEGADCRILGVDLADGGKDDSKAYINLGGHVRHYRTWTEGQESPGHIHESALATDAEIVVIDRIGVGAGPYHTVAARADRYYTLIGAKASEKSPDPSRWHDARAYWYDMLREDMLNGEVDLDLYAVDEHGNEVGKLLKDQLLAIRYDMDSKGAIQIESKKEMRKRGVDSPDDLDAVVFCVGVRARSIVADPLGDLNPGDTVLRDPWDDMEDLVLGMPI